MHRKKRSDIRKRMITYIRKRDEGFQNIPLVIADRALRISALSFFVLFSGIYIGRQEHSVNFILWSVVIWVFELWYSFRLLGCGEKQEYETVEGTVFELKSRHFAGQVYKVGIRLADGKLIWLLLDKRCRLKIGQKYRFYFKGKGQEALTGMQGIDAALNAGSFYGAEQLK